MRVLSPHHYALGDGSAVGGEVYERELLARLPEHGIHVVAGGPWPGLHWTRAPLRVVPWTLRATRSEPADLLRAASVRFSGPSLLAVRRLTGLPVVVHQHHLEPRWARLEARICAAADLTITVSHTSRDALVRRGVPDGRVAVVHQGIGRPEEVEPGCERLWPRPDALRLLYLGRLEQRKRPDLAVAAMRRAGVDASLVLAGAGGGVAPEEDVAVLGHVDEARKWGLYDAADLLLFPSALEGFGLVVAEAQSRGLPVIAAAGTGAQEAMAPGSSGLAVAQDAAALANAVEELAGAERRSQMAQAAREHAARFSWRAASERIAALYRDLASSRGRTSSRTVRSAPSQR